jgi:transposase
MRIGLRPDAPNLLSRGYKCPMEKKRQAYPSDLTDAQWDDIKDIVPAPRPGGRPAIYSRREVLNSLLYLRRTGCQWRALPHDLPPWKLVYWYFKSWRCSGLLDLIDGRVRSVVPRGGLLPIDSPMFDLRFGTRTLRRPDGPMVSPVALEDN